MHPLSARRPLLIDLAMALASAAFGFAVLLIDLEGQIGDPGLVDFLLVGAGCALVLFRRQQPIVTAVAIVGVRVAVILVTGTEIALVFATVFIFLEVGRRNDRRVGYGLAFAGSLATSIAIAVWGAEEDPLIAEFLAEAGSFLLPVALGDAARSREGRLAALIEAEADRRVHDERRRIARDLHDVVAHALTDISIQSGVAAHLLGDDNEQARRALERINASGKSSLEDLRAMVGVLRSTDEAPLQPTPTDDLGPIVEQAERIGIALSVKRSGSFAADTSDACIVAVHRIMQESVTNIARHAGRTSATLALVHHDEHVKLTINNSAPREPTTAPDSTGVGIVGMRERAESLGGSLTAEPTPSGGFVVEATLPYRLAEPS